MVSEISESSTAAGVPGRAVGVADGPWGSRVPVGVAVGVDVVVGVGVVVGVVVGVGVTGEGPDVVAPGVSNGDAPDGVGVGNGTAGSAGATTAGSGVVCSDTAPDDDVASAAQTTGAPTLTASEIATAAQLTAVDRDRWVPESSPREEQLPPGCRRTCRARPSVSRLAWARRPRRTRPPPASSPGCHALEALMGLLPSGMPGSVPGRVSDHLTRCGRCRRARRDDVGAALGPG